MHTGQKLNPKIIILTGPTGSGKSQLALDLCKKLDGEIVNFDSVQLYKGFNIGTAKPSLTDMTEVPHHLYDIYHWDQTSDADSYAKLARAKISELCNLNKIPVLVGGTGLYLRSTLNQKWHHLPKDSDLRSRLDALATEELYRLLKVENPQRAQELHPNDRVRILRAMELTRLCGPGYYQQVQPAVQVSDFASELDAFRIFIHPPRAELHHKITERTQKMLEHNLVQEVKDLLAKYCPKSAHPMKSIGYKQVLQYLDNQIKFDQLEEKIVFATRQYAKRQITWFKKTQPNLEILSPKLDPSELKKVFAFIES